MIRNANRFRSGGVEDRLANAGSSLPPAPIDTKNAKGKGKGKSMISQILSFGDDDEEEEEVQFQNPHERVRLEALKMLELADEVSSPYALRQTKSGGFAASPGFSTGPFDDNRGKRAPSALAGLDLHHTATGTSKRRDFSILSDDEEDDLQVIDVEDKTQKVRSPEQIVKELLRDEEEGAAKKSWSDRYATTADRHMIALTGGMTSSQVLDRLDAENEFSHKKSARNMFSTSPYDMKAPEETKSSKFISRLAESLSANRASPKKKGYRYRYFSGSLFGRNKKSDPRKKNLSPLARDGKQGWTEVDLSGAGSSLPPPPPGSNSRDWRYVILENRRRRRRCIIAVTMVCLVIMVAVLYRHVSNRSNRVNGVAGSNSGSSPVIFYVTSDIPFSIDDEEKLSSDLSSLPAEANFIIHLGNINEARVTLCPETVYADANGVLSKSPVPVFVLPGEEDWNNCPRPDEAWGFWLNNLARFEEKFDHSFAVERQLGRRENFAFLHDGVLFIGMTLVGGRVYDQEEWDTMYAENVRWTEKSFGLYNKDEYRAVIIFGHARPSQHQDAFFLPILNDLGSMNKQVLYVHADDGAGGSVTNLEQYVPYPQAPRFKAVQINQGGVGPPARVSVGFKGDLFHVHN